MYGFADPNTSLCEPLALLKREHSPLRQQMDDFARLAETIAAAAVSADPAGTADAADRLADLRARVAAFVAELDPHSAREEDHLFPMMARYIGREGGPIAVMEYEHETAKQLLKTFLEAAEREPLPASAARAGEIASHALRAHAILTEHFMKEENVLFPMAERLLNAEEKAELARAYGLSP